MIWYMQELILAITHPHTGESLLRPLARFCFYHEVFFQWLESSGLWNKTKFTPQRPSLPSRHWPIMMEFHFSIEFYYIILDLFLKESPVNWTEYHGIDQRTCSAGFSKDLLHHLLTTENFRKSSHLFQKSPAQLSALNQAQVTLGGYGLASEGWSEWCRNEDVWQAKWHADYAIWTHT